MSFGFYAISASLQIAFYGLKSNHIISERAKGEGGKGLGGGQGENWVAKD